ncbi:penicillin-binding protein 1B [Photorhabdus kleinii]|uniref:penicillin-binding protein 1B n=1 Tax=Photorhabdus kleinii TaxID=768034 RepID=UPI0021D4D674|nr:penicillin-binding protein 1B [Photorhabdus kleinii]MCT8343149.1 penicillin-binding protein 1B [Photorhabdus kleinii]
MKEINATEPLGRRKKKKNKKIKLSFLFKIILAVLFLVFCFAFLYIYNLAERIDTMINERVSNGFWDMPAQVYGKTYTLKIGEYKKKENVIKILNGARYHHVDSIRSPGDFHEDRDKVFIYLREFSYPDHLSKSVKVEVEFDKNRIKKIVNLDLGLAVNNILIEPRLVEIIYSPGDEQRIFMPLKNFPNDMINMLISTEDREFYNHHGLNPYSIARALYKNIKAGKRIQGGSTITQQVVKNMFLSRDRTMSRKLTEAIMSLVLEFKFNKDKILELYLNEIYLGQNSSFGIYGFPLASIYYFGRPINEISLEQQALLIGMAKGASLYNPWTKPTVAMERRNLVLKLSSESGVINKDDYLSSMKEGLNVQEKGSVFTKHPSFISMLKKEIRNNKNIVLNDLSGARVFSTFDPVSQEDAENAVKKTMPMLDKKTGLKDLQSVILVVDRKSGALLAIVGDRNVDYNGFNRASDTKRQVGSLIKPAVYLSALTSPYRFNLNTWIEDEPLSIDVGKKNSWSPKNPTRTYRGRVMLLDALAHSINVATVNLGMSVGIDNVAKTLKSIGIPSDRIVMVPSMLLGTLDMAPVELVEGIQTISNLGKHTGVYTLISIQDRYGKEIYHRTETLAQVVPEEAAWLTLYAMQESVRSGTSKRLGAGFKKYALAGKTGSSSGLRDSWFTGIDGEKVVLSWIGRDNNEPTKLWGASGSLLLTKAFFEINGVGKLEPVKPNDIYMVGVDAQGDIYCKENLSGDSMIGREVREIPIWGNDLNTICNTPPQFLPVSFKKSYSDESLDALF